MPAHAAVWNNACDFGYRMNQTEFQQDNPEAQATAFLREFQATGEYRRESIDRLAGLATSADAETAKAATRAIFASLVEPLADSFEARAVTLYNRLFAQLLHACRRPPAGIPLDEELRRFGLTTESELLSRVEQLRFIRKFAAAPEAKRNVKSAVVLSRVTIGADVAVTSVVLERLKREFPDARLTLVGNAKAAEIFGGESRLRFSEVHYRRAGTLTERLLSWLDVLAGVRSLVADLPDHEYVLVDPDSRLTQLGLLPLVEQTAWFPDAPLPTAKARSNASYLFFPSREFGGASRHSLGELTSIWMNAVFGGEEVTRPRLALLAKDRERAHALVRRLRSADSAPVVAINFGVGDNLNKRISERFETQLICRLLASGSRVILDKGAGVAETERIDRVLAEARQTQSDGSRGRLTRVVELDEGRLETLLQDDAPDADVLVWSGRLGILAALIAESDLYIGYDSAGQHMAAALGVPCLDVFAGYSSRRMLDRWRPTGSADGRVIAVDTLGGAVDDSAVLEEVFACARTMLE